MFKTGHRWLVDAHFEGEASRGRKLEGSDPSEPESRQHPFFPKARGGEKRDLSYRSQATRKRQKQSRLEHLPWRCRTGDCGEVALSPSKLACIRFTPAPQQG